MVAGFMKPQKGKRKRSNRHLATPKRGKVGEGSINSQAYVVHRPGKVIRSKGKKKRGATPDTGPSPQKEMAFTINLSEAVSGKNSGQSPKVRKKKGESQTEGSPFHGKTRCL